MDKKICPYPGLRPFTQEESIFFKGRDLHVRQIIGQLEERKFVLINGASGDGKSSLVYAGVIPNALAGFFHAEYNNWLFVDFRPERDPLNNLASVLSEKLVIPVADVSRELEYGFSSIISLYKKSRFHIDKNSADWKKTDEPGRKHLRSNAANLLILADQFEEFFTNQENYLNGRPSVNAYTTVNLLLETARIAMKEELPVYVVFTMRSDFLSQCVAFRHLPEFIGYSQFFVPRLKRNEVQQVIEEPARLAGGKISKRLVEILINELRDGFDQLPVLQHCLNSLWRIADDGDQELDLIHLVMIAGMDKKFLDEQDLLHFEAWLTTQPPFINDFYAKPSLANVLNAHANLLYLMAFDSFERNTDWAEKNISKKDAHFIIKTSLQCLTKIDNGRSVRNRMSLADIAKIINKKHITPVEICGVMNIFRMPSNTFIRPFIDPSDIATQYLPADAVLDITHESFIRNWELLVAWEIEEEQCLVDFRDFETQLNRWMENGMSEHFLLSAGNLTHFEEWYTKSNLGPYWILKYDDSEKSDEERLKRAVTTADLSHRFLHESHRRILKAERTRRMRLRIGIISALVVITTLSTLSYWAIREKANAVAQKKFALEQRKRAEMSKKKAEWSKRQAEDNAEFAIIARKQAETERIVADQMRQLADEKALVAHRETENAKREKARANEQLEIANEQRAKAESATGSANKLSRLAIAQSLAFKAEKNYDEGQVNLLLAYEAYLLNKRNGGDPANADIFQALDAAISNNNISPVIFEPKNTLATFDISSHSSIVSISVEGIFSTIDISNNKQVEKKLASLSPVNEAFIINDKALVGYENFEVALWDLNSGTKSVIDGFNTYIRSAALLQKNSVLVVGDRAGIISIFNINDNTNKHTNTIRVDSRVTSIVAMPDESAIFAACGNGNIVKCELPSSGTTILASIPGAITAMTLTSKGDKLVATTSLGRIKIIDVRDKSIVDIDVSPSMIDAVATDQEAKLLAVSSADKKIRIYQLATPSLKPFVLFRHNQRAKQLVFDSGKLFALCSDNKLRCWETSIDVIANNCKNMIKRDLTPEEWNTYAGQGVDYQNVK